jgi:unsaturated chondroitin disaccharide hydrolase
MKKHYILLLIFLIFNALSQSKIDVKKQFTLAAQQYEGMLKSHQDITKTPQST